MALKGCRGKVFLVMLWVLVFTRPVLAQLEFSPSALEKGVLLVASPSLIDPNFRQTVLLIIEHGRGGTVGVILNRPTDVLLADVLPDLPILKKTTHRLFAGGPVGVESLAAAVQEDKSTLEDVHEPYLIQAGFLERTGRGRQATKLAFDHFKRPTSLLFS